MLRASVDILVCSSSVDVSSSIFDHCDVDDASNFSTSPAEMLTLNWSILVAKHFRETNANSDRKRPRPRSTCAAAERRNRIRSSCSNNRPSPKETEAKEQIEVRFSPTRLYLDALFVVTEEFFCFLFRKIAEEKLLNGRENDESERNETDRILTVIAFVFFEFMFDW